MISSFDLSILPSFLKCVKTCSLSSSNSCVSAAISCNLQSLTMKRKKSGFAKAMPKRSMATRILTNPLPNLIPVDSIFQVLKTMQNSCHLQMVKTTLLSLQNILRLTQQTNFSMKTHSSHPSSKITEW